MEGFITYALCSVAVLDVCLCRCCCSVRRRLTVCTNPPGPLLPTRQLKVALFKETISGFRSWQVWLTSATGSLNHSHFWGSPVDLPTSDCKQPPSVFYYDHYTLADGGLCWLMSVRFEIWNGDSVHFNPRARVCVHLHLWPFNFVLAVSINHVHTCLNSFPRCSNCHSWYNCLHPRCCKYGARRCSSFQKQLYFSFPSPVAAVGNNICRSSGCSGVTGACLRCFHFHCQGRT